MRIAAVCVGMVFLLVGCSSGKPKVESGPNPSASGSEAVLSGGASGTEHRTKTSTAATLGIPPGHLPPPGQCRIWVPGKPPGHQSKAGGCSALRGQVPAGAWLVHRPSESRRHVRVWVYDEDRPVVSRIRLFEAATGRLLSEESPEQR